MKGRGKREIPEKTCRPTSSSGTIPTCKNPGIEPGSPWWEASKLTTQPPPVPRYSDALRCSGLRRAILAVSRLSDDLSAMDASQAIDDNRNALYVNTLRRNMLYPDWLQLIATHRCIVEYREIFCIRRRVSAESLIEARYRRQDCTPVQCFARRGDERVGARVSVAPGSPTLFGLRRAILRPLGLKTCSLHRERPISHLARSTLAAQHTYRNYLSPASGSGGSCFMATDADNANSNVPTFPAFNAELNKTDGYAVVNVELSRFPIPIKSVPHSYCYGPFTVWDAARPGSVVPGCGAPRLCCAWTRRAQAVLCGRTERGAIHWVPLPRSLLSTLFCGPQFHIPGGGWPVPREAGTRPPPSRSGGTGRERAPSSRSRGQSSRPPGHGRVDNLDCLRNDNFLVTAAKKASCRIGIVRPRNSKPKGIRRLSGSKKNDCILFLNANRGRSHQEKRVKSPVWPLPDFSQVGIECIIIYTFSWTVNNLLLDVNDKALVGSCRTMSLVGGFFSVGSPFPPFTVILAAFHSRLVSPSSAFKTSPLHSTGNAKQSHYCNNAGPSARVPGSLSDCLSESWAGTRLRRPMEGGSPGNGDKFLIVDKHLPGSNVETILVLPYSSSSSPLELGQPYSRLLAKIRLMYDFFDFLRVLVYSTRATATFTVVYPGNRHTLVEMRSNAGRVLWTIVLSQDDQELKAARNASYLVRKLIEKPKRIDRWCRREWGTGLRTTLRQRNLLITRQPCDGGCRKRGRLKATRSVLI
ncbi:hypothetical protein PR048_007752 [Dryococelus australis]|uniref:Uncharacterized protein n=1 Tax=Dryococelus australis TaxID=614101 RepID=A0ABQ9HW26_9NEOP|nr:hypothetical protein PR048_007752 [Dryococelus australis]